MEKTKKPTLTKKEQQLEWLKNEIEKDTIELENEKKRFIDQIKNFKKEEIVKTKEKSKITIWSRIKKVLMNL